MPVTRDPSDPNVFAAGGTPATAVTLGATALHVPDARPDLVVSGINNGADVGSQLILSGTVGAALAGAILVDPPIPGLAISAEHAGPGISPALPLDHLDQDADMTWLENGGVGVSQPPTDTRRRHEWRAPPPRA